MYKFNLGPRQVIERESFVFNGSFKKQSKSSLSLAVTLQADMIHGE
jgi:hypothetical protein